MPHLGDAELTPDILDDIVRGGTGWFVDEKSAIERIEADHDRLTGVVQGFLDLFEHLALDSARRPLNASAGGGGMSSTPEFLGDLIHVHRLALGTKADSSK